MSHAPSSATVWLLDGASIDAIRQAELCAQLGPSEQARLAQFLRPQRARQFLLGRLLLRHALRQTLAIDNRHIVLTERKHAAPLLQLHGVAAPHAVQFSLSHSGAWIACALGHDAALGLDIEVRDAPRDHAALAAAAFAPQQQAWLQQQPPAQRAAAFYRLWNCQEALYKLGPSQRHASGVNCRLLAHPQLAICLCSAATLDDVQVREIVKIQ